MKSRKKGKLLLRAAQVPSVDLAALLVIRYDEELERLRAARELSRATRRHLKALEGLEVLSTRF